MIVLSEVSLITLNAKHGPSVVTASLFFNEIELVRLRNDYLGDFLDAQVYFVASHLHSGKKRSEEFSIAELSKSSAFAFFVHVEVPLEVLALGSRWAIEEYSRAFAADWVVRNFPNSLIILGDIDEVPSQEQIQEARKTVVAGSPKTIPMREAFRNPSLVSKDRWLLTKAFMAVDYVVGIRYRSFPSLKQACGWHLRYMGFSAARHKEKVGAFAHREYDRDIDFGALFEFAEEFQIAHIPSLRRRGQGRLSVAPKEMEFELANLIEREWGPFLQGTRGECPPALKQLVASRLVSRAYEKSSLDEINSYSNGSMSSLAKVVHGVLAVATVAIERTGISSLVRGTVRLMSRGLILNSHRTFLDKARGVNEFGFLDQLGIASNASTDNKV